MTVLKTDILRQATERQRRGSDPGHSAWVSASAGSGKTKVLGDRVLRLLLANVPPARILCLTFTKAAAAEMSYRVAERLAAWAAASDDELRGQLRDLTGGGDITALIPVARRLFARVLDTPGGMKIMTIHAFCQSLLRRFPLEADVAPHFSLIEERDAAALMGEARDEMLNAARAEPDGTLRQALDLAVTRLLEGRLNDLMRELLARRARFERLVDRFEMPAIRAALRTELGVGPDESRESVLRGAVADSAFATADLLRAAAALADGKKTDIKRAETLKAWLAQGREERIRSFDEYCGSFLTKDKTILDRLATNGIESAHPGTTAVLDAEARRLAQVCAHLRAVEIATATEALIHVSADVLKRYTRRKAVAAQLDYEDLVLKSVDLLRRPGIAPWVLYKLDGGIDHVMIDEAQDTNPEQWGVIDALTDEFFAGQGRAEGPRSIFAVGDRKQSIFSFQGAAPEEFLRYERHYHARAERFEPVELNISFRSTEAVLTMVDTVFAGAARAGVAVAQETIQHQVSRIGEFGEIVVWPVARPVATEPPAPWAPPTIRELAATPEARLAESIAGEIAHLLKTGSTRRRGKSPSRVTPGDIMILVRNRTKFMDLMVRALKRRFIPVVGVDRMMLLDQIAVQDLVAFCRFLLLPEDDLNLAALLKSPLVGVTEEELLAICVDRAWKSVWQRVQEFADTMPAAARARDLLEPFLNQAGFATPYEQLSELLEAKGGRRRLYARLGDECGEAIDEFLNLALTYETRHAPNPQDMLAWMEQGELEVKRDLDEGAGRVRIMTVHGAKGLEAPIVFLADQRRTPVPQSGLFWIPAGDALLPIWSANKDSDDLRAAAARAEARQRQQEEENRLLYVALTRAEERLYVCGWRGVKTINDPSWHDNVREAATKMRHVVEPRPDWLGGADEGWEGELLRVSLGEPMVAADAPAEALPEVALPAWLNAPIPDLPDPPRPLTPSRPTEPEPATLSPLGADQGWRYQRGRVIHHLLEMLPQLPAPARLAAAEAYLGRRSTAVPPEERAPLAREVTALLEVPEFAAIFGPASRPEVPVVATRRRPDGKTEVLSGQIDRLVVLENAVWVVDFKSNRPAPMQVTHVSQQYVGQLAAYRSALANLYGDREIRCFLLWTEGPRLMEIPAAMLDAHGSHPAHPSP